MIYKVGVESRRFDVFFRQVPGELMHNGPDHLQVPQLLGADICQQALELRVGHGVPLAQIPQRRTKLPVCATIHH